MIGLDNPLHSAIVRVVVLLVFGAKRLPTPDPPAGRPGRLKRSPA